MFKGKATVNECIVIGSALLRHGYHPIHCIVSGLYERSWVQGLFLVLADIFQETLGILQAAFTSACNNSAGHSQAAIPQTLLCRGKAHFQQAAHAAQAIRRNEGFIIRLCYLEQVAGITAQRLRKKISLKRMLRSDSRHTLYVTISLHI